MKENTLTAAAVELRQKAEAAFREKAASATPESEAALSPEQIRRTLQELRVHQIELEMQNEELRRAQVKLDAARARYFDLYDLAPVGYVTVSEPGMILEANLTAATLLGIARGALIKQPFSRFILKADSEGYYLMRKQLVATGDSQSRELRMLKPDSTQIWVQLVATLAPDADGAAVRVTLSDITRSKQTEEVQTFLAQANTRKADDSFFNGLARFLAQSLQMDYVCIDRLEGDQLTAQTLAVWCDGHFEDNVTYALKDTPCGDVVGQTVCCFPASVCKYFPRDAALQTLRAESYVGVTLFSHAGQPIGLIAVIGRGPLANRAQAEATLKLVAGRAAGELERFEHEKALRESETRFREMFDDAPIGYHELDAEGRIVRVNRTELALLGYSAGEMLGRQVWEFVEDSELSRRAGLDKLAGILPSGQSVERTYRRKDGTGVPVLIQDRLLLDQNGRIIGIRTTVQDITERKLAEELIARRIVALTRPLEGSAVAFADLFRLEDIQRLQDEFAVATGVASIITQPDGTPLTAPSNFTRLCSEIIRQTEKGCANCFKSDAAIGRFHPAGPIVQLCLSGGLWDAGASITVGGHHVANWLIGQVRDETQTEEKMRDYARTIGADEGAFMEAFRAVPAMSRQRFEQIAQVLFSIATQLSISAYQNIQQARFISERKQAEEALQLNQRSLALAHRSAKAGAWDWDMTTQRLQWTPELFVLFGLDPDKTQANFETWHQVLHPDDRETAGARLEQAIKERRPLSNEYRVVRPDGQVRWIHAVGETTYDPSGKPVRMTGLCTDITERRAAEQTLRLRGAALEAAANAVVITDRQGNIEWVNPAFSALSGWTFAEALGKDAHDLVKSGEQPEEFYAQMWAIIHAGKVWQGQMVNRRKDGALRTEEMTITPLRDEQGGSRTSSRLSRTLPTRKRWRRSSCRPSAWKSSDPWLVASPTISTTSLHPSRWWAAC
jgi:PAS domain S-box-containing protein